MRARRARAPPPLARAALLSAGGARHLRQSTGNLRDARTCDSFDPLPTGCSRDADGGDTRLSKSRCQSEAYATADTCAQETCTGAHRRLTLQEEDLRPPAISNSTGVRRPKKRTRKEQSEAS